MTQPLIRVLQIESDELNLRIHTVIQTEVVLDEISDVVAPTPTLGEALLWSGSPQQWRPGVVAGSGTGGSGIISTTPQVGDLVVYGEGNAGSPIGSPVTYRNQSTIQFINDRFLVKGVTATNFGSPRYGGSPQVLIAGSPANKTSLEITSSVPGLMFYDTDAPANEKSWRFVVDNGDFIGEIRSDSGKTANHWIELTRSGNAISDLQLYVGQQEQAIHAIAGAAVEFYHNNINVAETTTAAGGGLRVNNLATGAGFERVLTTSDISSGGGSAGSPLLNIRGGDGIDVTFGSPKVSIAVDGTVARGGDNISTFVNDANYLKTIGSPFLDIRGGTGITVAFGSPRVTITNSAPNVVQNLFDEFRSDSGNAVAIGPNDKFTFTGGVGINTSIGGSPVTLTITNTLVGSPSSYIENVVGGDGIIVTTGSPDVTVAVDATVLRTTSSLGDLADVNTVGVLQNQVLTYAGSPLGWIPVTGAGGSGGGDSVFAGDGISIAAGSPLSNKTISVNTTVLRTSSNLDDLANVIGSPTVAGDTLYFDGTNWNTLAAGTAGQILTMGSPLLPTWKPNQGASGGGSPLLNIVGGDGINVTYGSPKVTVAVDATVVRDGDNISTFVNDANYLKTIGSPFLDIRGGTGITVAFGSPRVTITNSDPNVDQNLWLNIAGDVGGPVAANTTTDTLTLAGGTRIRTNISGDTVTINMTGSPVGATNVVGGDGITVTTGSPEVTITVDATVFRTTDTLDNISDVNAGSPTRGAILYNDGTNWLKLAPGLNSQILTMGSPLLPIWRANQGGGGGGSPIQNIRGGDGITVTLGSPVATISVDSTVARLGPGSPPNGSPSQVFQNPNTFLNDTTFEVNPTTVDGTGVKRPVGLGVLPPYEIDTNATFDTAHTGMVWHVDAGSPAVTFTAPNDTTIEVGSMWQVQNDDVENVTIAQGSPSVTILRLGAGGAPVSGNVLVQQGGIVSIYKYTDTEYWLYGDSEAIGFGSPISADFKGLIDVSITGGAGSPKLPELGDTLYYDGTNWVNLPRGTNGQVLNMGSPLLPSWKTLGVSDLTGSPVALPNIVGGTGISVATGSPQFTITNDDPNVDQNLWLNIAGDVGGPVAANTTTDTLTIAGGTRTRTNIAGDTVTINMTGSPIIGQPTKTTTVVAGSPITLTAIASHATASYRSAEFLVQAVRGNNFHTTKLLAVHDGTNASYTEFSTVTLPSFFGSPAAGSPTISGEQATYSVDVNGGNLRLLATPREGTGSITFKVDSTLITV